MLGKYSNIHKHYLVFITAQEYYAFNIAYVQELCIFKDITKLPLSSSFVKGVYDREGDVIPVIGLRELFSLAPAEHCVHGIVIECKERMVIIQVDSITGIFPPAEIQEVKYPHSNFNDFQLFSIQGIMKLSNGLSCYCIDIEKMMTPYFKKEGALVPIPSTK